MERWMWSGRGGGGGEGGCGEAARSHQCTATNRRAAATELATANAVFCSCVCVSTHIQHVCVSTHNTSRWSGAPPQSGRGNAEMYRQLKKGGSCIRGVCAEIGMRSAEHVQC